MATENNNDNTIEIPIPELPTHLRCHSTPHSGRTITTRIKIAKGTAAFTEVPFAHSIHFSARKSMCDNCFAQCNDDNDDDSSNHLEYECDGRCGVHYCTASCKEQGLIRHVRICHLIQQTNDKKTNKNSQLMNESIALLISLSSASQPLQNVMSMMMDNSTKKVLRDTAKAESKFRALSHNFEKEGKVLESRGAYAAALSVKNLNGIGIYNAYGTEVAVTLCPTLAMVNHSCYPNTQQITDNGSCRLRALRDIDIGEELSYSYVSLEGSDVDRKTAITDNWRFVCKCHRCLGGECSEFDARHTCYCGAVCYEADRTSGECVCNHGRVVVKKPK